MKAEQENNDDTVTEPVDHEAGTVNVEEVASGANPQPEAPDPGELKTLREQAAKAQEHWDRFVRLNADFDNFKKRAAKDRLDAIKYANEALIERLLPVMDNFEAALAAGTSGEGAQAQSLLAGVKMIATQLKGVLAESGLEEIDATGKPFDPAVHEALSQQPSNEVPEGHVLQLMRKGYRLKERLVRPAAVVVATRPGDGAAGPA
jgi:molecular chaperone GrpE